MYFQPNSCNTHADCEWAQGTFLRQLRKVPPAHAQQVFGSSQDEKVTLTYLNSLSAMDGRDRPLLN